MLVHILTGDGDELEAAALEHLQEVIGQLVNASERNLGSDDVKDHVKVQVVGRAGNADDGIAKLLELMAEAGDSLFIGTIDHAPGERMLIDHPEVAALHATCVNAGDDGDTHLLKLCLIGLGLDLADRMTEVAHDGAFLDHATIVAGKGHDLVLGVGLDLDDLDAVILVGVNEHLPFLDHDVVLFGIALLHPFGGDDVDAPLKV